MPSEKAFLEIQFFIIINKYSHILLTPYSIHMSYSPSVRSSRWMETRPSRFNVAKIYSLRLLNTWGNSKPYLSGDLFSDESDISFYSPRFRRLKPSRKQLRAAEVVFCPSSRLEEMLDSYGRNIKPKVIICGNDDHDFTELPLNLPDSVRHLFLQNSFIPNSNFVTSLPIGLENLRFGKNGFPKLMKNKLTWEERNQKIMLGPFGLTHPDRYEIRDKVSQNDDTIEIFTERLSPKELSEVSQRFKFVVSVRGNGVDTHRHWETAYRGSFAIVKKDSWSKNFVGFQLPFVLVDNFERRELIKIISQIKDSPKDPRSVKILWWPFWKSLIKEKL